MIYTAQKSMDSIFTLTSPSRPFETDISK